MITLYGIRKTKKPRIDTRDGLLDMLKTRTNEILKREVDKKLKGPK